MQGVWLVTRPLSLSVDVAINCQIDQCDVTAINSVAFVSLTSRKLIIPKLLRNKRPETGETLHELTSTNLMTSFFFAK